MEQLTLKCHDLQIEYDHMTTRLKEEKSRLKVATKALEAFKKGETVE